MFHLLIVGTKLKTAHTKQTPKNPHLNWPATVIDRDVQPEWRKHAKPSKTPIKGKQPRKNLARKLLWLGTTPTGWIKKPHHYRPGMVALGGIRRYQWSTACLIKRPSFQKLITEISQEYRVCPDGPRTPSVQV